MRVFLILSISFLTSTVFGAKQTYKWGEGIFNGGIPKGFLLPQDRLSTLTQEITSDKIAPFLTPTELKTLAKVNHSLQTTIQKNIIINMKEITPTPEDISKLSRLLDSRKNVSKLRIKNLNWDILKSVLEANTELIFNNLVSLDLSENSITSSCIEEINESLFSRTPMLRSLKLYKNKIESSGAETIANSQYTKRLTDINLWGNAVKDQGAIAIAQLKDLASINLGDNEIGDSGAIALAQLNNLTNISIGKNQIGDEGAEALAQLNKLTIVDLGDNKIGNRGVRALVQLDHLSSLSLWGNKLTDTEAEIIANSEHMKTLVSINLGENKIGDGGTIALAQSNYLHNINKLYLYKNKINCKGALAIVASFKNLNVLFIRYNPIEDAGNRAIESFKDQNPQCTVLY